MLLKLEKIGKIYDSGDILTVGIRGIDLAFDYNEFVTIEGESGSGKSTLLNVIGANDTYEEGELYFNGEPTSHYSESDWEKYREKNIATIVWTTKRNAGEEQRNSSPAWGLPSR